MMAAGIMFYYDYCKTCLSNEYTQDSKKRWVRKNPDEENFEISIIPANVQLKIIEKMDYFTLRNLRLANSYMNEFVGLCKQSTRVAMFHNWTIRFKEDAKVILIPPKKIIAASNIQDEEIGCTERNASISFSLERWEHDEFMRNELRGNYHPALIEMVLGGAKEEAIDKICNFLEWTGITNTLLIFQRASYSAIERICTITEPKAISLFRCSQCPEDIFTKNYLRNLTQITIYVTHLICPIIQQHMDKLEFYQIENAGPLHLRDINRMLKLWTFGQSPIKEMLVAWSLQLTDVLHGLTPEMISEREVIRRFGSIPEQHDKLDRDFYVLESSSGQTALVIKYLDEFHFKVMEDL